MRSPLIQMLRFFLWGIFCFPFFVLAQSDIGALKGPKGDLTESINLYDKYHQFTIDAQVHYLEDPTHQLSIQDITQHHHSQFQPNAQGPLNFGYSNSTIWIKAPLRYWGAKEYRQFLLLVDVPLLDSANIYLVRENGELETHSVRYEVPLSERYLLYPGNVIPFSMDKGEKAVLYIQLKSDFSLHLPLKIFTKEGFVEYASVVELMHGAFWGSIIIMIIYNLLIYFSMRDKAYLYYVMYIFAYLVFMITERVHGLQLFGDIPEILHKKYLAIYIWASWIGGFSMGRYFLKSATMMPAFDRIILIIIFSAMASIVLSFFADPAAAIQWAVMGTIICTVFLACFGYAATRKKLPGAPLYFWAWAVNFTGVAVYALTVTGFLPYGLLTESAPQIGIVCHLILISLALADKIKSSQKLALIANQESIRHLTRYQTLFKTAFEGIFQLSLERKFIEANPSLLAFLDLASVEELASIETDAIDTLFLSPFDRARVLSELEKGNNIDIEAPYRRESAPENQGRFDKWARVKLKLITIEEGSPSHYEGSFVDVTEKKKRDAFDKEREHNSLLRQAAEASSAAKSQFLANMSHEIRTPLTAIVGYGESLLDDSLDASEKMASAETVVRSGHHLLALLNDILDHSKIDSDNLEITISSTDLVCLIEEITAYFQPRAKAKSLEFVVEYEFPIPSKIHTDPTRLKQILINLCGNALKFTARGLVRIRVSFCSASNRLSVSVKDSGIGLTEEQMSRLFDPFAQAAPSIARQYGGTGLGLNISKKLAELLGGTVSVESDYGQGSEFIVTVAVGDDAAQCLLTELAELPLNPARIHQAQAPKLQGNILYAEDCVEAQGLVNLLVAKTGAKMTVADNGAEAFSYAASHSYDLILMDMEMPVMNGYDATHKIRKAGNNTPIVALTANVMSDDIEEYMKAGCNEFLAKPIEKEKFYGVLSEYLEVVD